MDSAEESENALLDDITNVSDHIILEHAYSEEQETDKTKSLLEIPPSTISTDSPLEETISENITNSTDSVSTENKIQDEKKDLLQEKVISRELKSLLNAAKESNLDTNISHKRRKPMSLDANQTKQKKSSKVDSNLDGNISANEIESINKDVFTDTLLSKYKKDNLADIIDGSSADDVRKKRKAVNDNDANVNMKPNKDKFCWRCHNDNGSLLQCETCPRSFHRRCLKQTISNPDRWACPECLAVLEAESTKTRSISMKDVSLEKLCELLKYAVNRMMNCTGSEPFIHPVDVNHFTDYEKYVVQPMDLTTLQNNIRNNMYGSTVAFLADAKWILHNSIIYNSYHSKLSSAAKSIFKICQQEMSEIETCPECYQNANTKKNSWFVEVCTKPHILLWAKLKGFPYWPGKAMTTNSAGFVDVRFFGAHDRAWIPIKECFLYSKKDPNTTNKNKSNIAESIKEVNIHIQNLKEKFGEFNYAPYRTPYDPYEELKILEVMLPKYEPSAKVKQALTSIKFIRSPTEENVKSFKKRSRSRARSVPNFKSKSTPQSDNENDSEFLNKSSIEDNYSEKLTLPMNSDSESEEESKKILNTSDVADHLKNGVKMNDSDDSKSDTLDVSIENRRNMKTRGRKLINVKPERKRRSSLVLNTSSKRRNSELSSISDSSRLSDKINNVGKLFNNTEMPSTENFDESISNESNSKENGDLCNKNKEFPNWSQSKISTMAERLMKKITESGNVDEAPKQKSQEESFDNDEVNSIDNEKEKASEDQNNDNKTNENNNEKIDKNDNSIDTSSTEVNSEKDSLIKNNNISNNKKSTKTPENNQSDVNSSESVNPSEALNENTQKTSEKINELKSDKSQKPNIIEKNITEGRVLRKRKSKQLTISREDSDFSDDEPLTKINKTNKIKYVNVLDIISAKDANKNNSDSASSNTNLINKDIGGGEIKLEPLSDNEMYDYELISKSNVRNSKQKKEKKQTNQDKSSKKVLDNLSKIIDSVASNTEQNVRSEVSLDTEEITLRPVTKLIQYNQKARKSFPSSPHKMQQLNETQAVDIKQVLEKTDITLPKHIKIVPVLNSSQQKILSSTSTTPVTSTPARISSPSTNFTPIINSTPTTNSQSTSISSSTTNSTLTTNSVLTTNTTSNTNPITTATNTLYATAVSKTQISNILLPTTQSLLTMIPHSGIIIPTATIPVTTQVTTTNNSQKTNSTSTLDTNTSTITTNVTSQRELPTGSSLQLETPIVKSMQTLIGELFTRPPKLKPRPPGPLSDHFDEGLPSTAGPTSSLINSVSHRLSDYFRGLLKETLYDLATIGDPEAKIRTLELEIESLKHKHVEEMLEFRKNINSMLKDIQKSIVEEKAKIVEETRAACEAERIKCVQEAKSKQWCAFCFKEALLYCCWNTSYCGYECQQNHWSTHMNICTQAKATGDVVLVNDNASPSNSTAVTSEKTSVSSVTKQSVKQYVPFNNNNKSLKSTRMILKQTSKSVPMYVPLQRTNQAGQQTITLLETNGNYEILSNTQILGGKIIPSTLKLKPNLVTLAPSSSNTTSANTPTQKTLIWTPKPQPVPKQVTSDKKLETKRN